jgi:hypothetical protein
MDDSMQTEIGAATAAPPHVTLDNGSLVVSLSERDAAKLRAAWDTRFRRFERWVQELAGGTEDWSITSASRHDAIWYMELRRRLSADTVYIGIESIVVPWFDADDMPIRSGSDLLPWLARGSPAGLVINGSGAWVHWAPLEPRIIKQFGQAVSG